jgi:hypothetical protein
MTNIPRAPAPVRSSAPPAIFDQCIEIEEAIKPLEAFADELDYRGRYWGNRQPDSGPDERQIAAARQFLARRDEYRAVWEAVSRPAKPREIAGYIDRLVGCKSAGNTDPEILADVLFEFFRKEKATPYELVSRFWRVVEDGDYLNISKVINFQKKARKGGQRLRDLLLMYPLEKKIAEAEARLAERKKRYEEQERLKAAAKERLKAKMANLKDDDPFEIFDLEQSIWDEIHAAPSRKAKEELKAEIYLLQSIKDTKLDEISWDNL